MARFSRPASRFFPAEKEMRLANRSLSQYQQLYGTTVDWWFFLPGAGDDDGEYTVPGADPATTSQFNDLYDEGEMATAGSTEVVGGRKFRGPVKIPVLSAQDTQGGETSSDQAFGTWDHVVLRMSFEQARRAGLEQDIIRNRGKHLLDRFVYRSMVFDIKEIHTEGHVSNLDDLMILIRGVQLRDDQLQDSPQFTQYTRMG